MMMRRRLFPVAAAAVFALTFGCQRKPVEPRAVTGYENAVKEDIRNFGTTAAVDMYVGTRFTMPVGANVSSVEIKMYKHGNPKDDLTAYLYGDPPAAIAGAASDPVSGAALTADTGAEWVKFNFKQPARLDAAKNYWIMLKRDGKADTAAFYKIKMDTKPSVKDFYDYFGARDTGGKLERDITLLFRVVGKE